MRNYTIAWFALVWLQFVLQFDEEAIVWMCNDLPKKLKNKMIHYLEMIEYIYMIKQKRNIRERWVTFKRIIHDYNYWKKSKDSELTNYI